MSENLRVGAYGWRHDHWQQSFYEDELPEDWQLTFYANEYSTVLVPASYLDESRDIEQWCDDVNENFRFYFEWPEQAGADSELLAELMSADENLGGILLNTSTQLSAGCPVYDWRANNGLDKVWQPSHPVKTDLAVFAVEQSDLRQQRAWLESFVEDSAGKARALLVTDPELDIQKLRELKTLVELKGL